MHALFSLLLMISAKMGYWGIVFLMAIESSFVPLPSELVIPPAAYLASKGEMNIYLVVLAGSVGSLIGASFNYILSVTLGRKIVYALADSKLAKLFFVNRKKIEHAEKYFLLRGNLSTFVGRLVPAVRHLISIPAGLSRMDFKKFLLFTFLGSGLWMLILAFLGYTFGANQDLLIRNYKNISYFLIVVFILLVGYFIYANKKKKVN